MNGEGEIRFEWDLNKAQSNVEKHGVTFEEATTVSTMTTAESMTIRIIRLANIAS